MVALVSSSLLKLENIPELVGEYAEKRVKDMSRVLFNTRWPLYFIGPSGSGKSIFAMNLGKEYAQKLKVPCYYIQLSPEQTKTSLILGLRLDNGSLKPVKAVVAEAMEKGGIIIIDEATHSTQNLLLMFNSILDRTSVTSIGDEIVYSDKKFRVIFCSNDSNYAGNVKLPQSFAQRMVTFPFDYPPWIDEAKIIKRIAKDECECDIDVPNSVIKYITSTIRKIRTKDFPLSARNGAIAVVLLQLAEKKKNSDMVDKYFTNTSNVEALRRQVFSRISDKNEKDVDMNDLMDDQLTETLKYVTSVGIDRFKEIMFSACMYYLDVDGMEMISSQFRTNMEGMII